MHVMLDERSDAHRVSNIAESRITRGIPTSTIPLAVEPRIGLLALRVGTICCCITYPLPPNTELLLIFFL